MVKEKILKRHSTNSVSMLLKEAILKWKYSKKTVLFL
jgi:hypothetical protein